MENKILNHEQWDSMNVLIILPRWSRTFINNNIGKVMVTLYEREANIHLYCDTSEEDVFFKISFPNSFLHNFRNNKTLLGCLFNFIRLTATVKFNIILWTYAGYRENFILALLKIFTGTPYVIKSDSYVIQASKTLLGNIRSKIRNSLFLIFPAKMANLVLVETPAVKVNAQTFYKTNNIYYLPNGVPVKKFQEYSELFLQENSPIKNQYILYTGRILAEKGIDLLIESFEKIAYKIPYWNLEIVGLVWDEEYNDKCRQMVIDAKLDGRVNFHPVALGIELYRWYYFAEFFVLPSRKEGLANRIPEAMFFRNPIVAYDVGQTKNMVSNETGICVAPGDINAFADAMLYLADNQQIREEMGNKAKRIIKSNYNDDILIPQLLKQCEEFLKRK